MKQLKVLFLLFLSALATGVAAQNRDKVLTIQVSSVEGDNLNGQPLTLVQTDYQVSYGSLKLDENGTCVVKVYGGNHELTVEREGFIPVTQAFEVAETETAKTINVTLVEQTRQPYALTATVDHNVHTGTNDVLLTWNTEQPAFFDDFESYEGWSIQFGEWTGIDADNEAAAPLVGTYPNRGVMQYAQIINPLTVNPTWWYDYPILRPYGGQQYVGFTRTSSGNANDDWLVSPSITIGTDNVLTFMGKAADRFPERFMVYVTTVPQSQSADYQPKKEDFTRIDNDNYETADYTGWKQYRYDLSAYAGQQLRFAIRYISHYNRYGSFMLMIDDVYVGQQQTAASVMAKARRYKSPANANERFLVYLDGEQVGQTTQYDYTFSNVASGDHTLGVQAVYLQAQSEVSTIQVQVPEHTFAHVVFNVTAQSMLSPDGQQLSLVNVATVENYELTVTDGKAELLSLPFGQYVLNIAEGAFNAYQQTIEVTGDQSFDIQLTDHVLAPYNITATPNEEGRYQLRWNQRLLYTDSFEDYPDFATGSFGDWLTYDVDKLPVYPIALGSASNIVSFPGSGTATNPTAIAPMVFNPWNTVPAMLPQDAAIKAPTGDKTVIFFSSQRATADKWLISPLLDIYDNYELRVTAKGYEAAYPESMDFCISDGSTSPSDFTPISTVSPLSAGEWTIYATDLSAYAGQTVRLAVHYKTYDGFLAQIDDFTVGSKDGEGVSVDYGNVVRFEISVDGTKVGESTTPSFLLPLLSTGRHVIGIKAVYLNDASEVVEYVIDTTGITTLQLESSASAELYDLQGRRVSPLGAKGIYLQRKDGKTVKVRR